VLKSGDFELKIGRHSENDVVIEDKSVSRFHARLFCRGNKYFIENVQGQNGIYVNGIRIYTTTKLEELDVVRLGGYLLNWKQYVRNQKISVEHTKEYKVSFENVLDLASIPQIKQKSNGNKVKVDYFLVVLILFIILIVCLLVI
jgi:pSer/pThr/pTyr-binding forkhead associated (FHA) protein